MDLRSAWIINLSSDEGGRGGGPIIEGATDSFKGGEG